MILLWLRQKFPYLKYVLLVCTLDIQSFGTTTNPFPLLRQYIHRASPRAKIFHASYGLN